MKVILSLVLILFASTTLASECIPKGTSFEETMRSKDFKNKNTGNFIKAFTKSIEAMAKYRKQNCDASPQMVKDNCRSSCMLLSYKNYQDTCKRYCEIQRLKIVENQLQVCENKITKLIEIEKNIRKADKASGNR